MTRQNDEKKFKKERQQYIDESEAYRVISEQRVVEVLFYELKYVRNALDEALIALDRSHQNKEFKAAVEEVRERVHNILGQAAKHLLEQAKKQTEGEGQ